MEVVPGVDEPLHAWEVLYWTPRPSRGLIPFTCTRQFYTSPPGEVRKFRDGQVVSGPTVEED